MKPQAHAATSLGKNVKSLDSMAIIAYNYMYDV